MLWLKAFHIVFVVAWFAGLFALPRLFVYHTQVTDPAENARFKLMERRMFGMMTFGAIATAFFGISTLVTVPGFLRMGWLHAKLLFVALLIGYHIWCYRLLIAFRKDRNVHSERWYRLFNEAPLIPLIAIVLLVVLKPF